MDAPEGVLFQDDPCRETPLSTGEAEPPTRKTAFKRVRTRMRNSFEHGLAWSYISNALRDMVDLMKRGSVTIEPTFQFPAAADYKRYELWLRDSMQAMHKAMVVE